MTYHDDRGRAAETERAIIRNLALTGPANQGELSRILRLRRMGGKAPGSDANLSLVIRRADNFLNKPLGSITADEAQRLMEHLKAFPGHQGRPAAPKVIHMRSVLLRAYLKEILGYASREKLPRDLERATYIPKPKDNEDVGVALTDAQFRRLVDAAVRLFRGREAPRKATEFAALLWTKWDGGPRIGELLSLNVEEADLRSEMAGMLYVRESRWGHRLKTGPREIPVTACVPALRLWLERHPARNNPSAPLFPAFSDNAGERPLDYQPFRKLFKKAAELSGVEIELPPGTRLRPHDLRHTSATNDAAAGDAALRKKHGWSKKSSMPGHYTSHLTADRVLVQMQELASKRFGTPNPAKEPRLEMNPLPPGAVEDGVLDALLTRLASRAQPSRAP